MKLQIVLAALLVSSFSMNADAQRRNKTLKDENRSIRQGVRSGQLTGKETVQLKRQERKLKNERRRFLANDGKLSRREKAKLIRDEKRLDRNIRRQKHDGQIR